MGDPHAAERHLGMAAEPLRLAEVAAHRLAMRPALPAGAADRRRGAGLDAAEQLVGCQVSRLAAAGGSVLRSVLGVLRQARRLLGLVLDAVHLLLDVAGTAHDELAFAALDAVRALVEIED